MRHLLPFAIVLIQTIQLLTPCSSLAQGGFGLLDVKAEAPPPVRSDPDAWLDDASIPDDPRRLVQKLAYVGGSAITADERIRRIEATLDEYLPGGSIYKASDMAVARSEARLSELIARQDGSERSGREIRLEREYLATQRDFRDNESARMIRERGALAGSFSARWVMWSRLKQEAGARGTSLKNLKVAQIDQILERRTGRDRSAAMP